MKFALFTLPALIATSTTAANVRRTCHSKPGKPFKTTSYSEAKIQFVDYVKAMGKILDINELDAMLKKGPIDLNSLPSIGEDLCDEESGLVGNITSTLPAIRVRKTNPSPPTSSSGASSSTTPETCANPRTRVEWRNMSAQDKTGFVDAVKCLMNKPSNGAYSFNNGWGKSRSRYQDLVSVHLNNVNTIHGGPQFLVFHRFYLWIFENMLREECGMTGAFPWWDETKDVGNFAAAPIFAPEYLGRLTHATTTVTRAGFLDNSTLTRSSRGQYIHRGVDEKSSSRCTAEYVTLCNNYPDYEPMEACQEEGIHGFGHNACGGTMLDTAKSPMDPAFFLHHGKIDQAYWSWQQRGGKYRERQVGGKVAYADGTKTNIRFTGNYEIDVHGLYRNMRTSELESTLSDPLCYQYDYIS